jgi:predicted transcriptional regulator
MLRILEQEPSVSQRELARRLGMSLGGIHYCLQALVSKGFVKLEASAPEALRADG